MDPLRNPFTPAFGTTPLIIAGRRQIIGDMRIAFETGPGNPNLSTILIGARGTGKTVCMTRIGVEAMGCGWVEVRSIAIPGMLDDILEQARRLAADLTDSKPRHHMTSLGIGPVSASWETRAPSMGNWRSQMTDVISRIEEHGSGLLISVDEVRADVDEMVTLAAVFQLFVVERHRVGLVMAGLPYHVHQLINDKSVSFLRRSMQYQLGKIDDADVREAFYLTIREAGGDIANDALDACVEAIGGFAYLMQLVGYRTWNAGRGADTITLREAELGIANAWRDMDEHILASTYRDLSRNDLRFLEAMLPDRGTSRIADIAERMGVQSRYASSYKSRLLAQGVISEVARGEVAHAIPGFADYVRRRQT